MSAYPNVLDEISTMRRIIAGASIARYGDGEFKIARGDGARIKSQEYDETLSRRLREILIDSGSCMVGIPNIHEVQKQTPGTQKAEFWTKHERCAGLLDGARRYVSSFITRPDSAPWIDTPEYWEMVESLWAGRDITLVTGSGKSLKGEDLASAARVSEIAAPKQHAWAEYDKTIEKVLATKPSRVIVCLGPTATVMAVDLCRRGIQTLDLGHIAIFMRKRRRGEPMAVTEEDRAVDRRLPA